MLSLFFILSKFISFLMLNNNIALIFSLNSLLNKKIKTSKKLKFKIILYIALLINILFILFL